MNIMNIFKKVLKYIIKGIFIIIIMGLIIISFKILGTSYCYIKIPETKEEASKLISFCGRSDLLFDVFFSKGRAKIYDSYSDNFQNSVSASDIIAYYTKNEPLKHLKRIEVLTEIITDERWTKEKKFYFILVDDFFENNLPLEFRQKLFKKIYEKYYPIISKNNELSERDKKINIDNINEIYKKLNMHQN